MLLTEINFISGSFISRRPDHRSPEPRLVHVRNFAAFSTDQRHVVASSPRARRRQPPQHRDAVVVRDAHRHSTHHVVVVVVVDVDVAADAELFAARRRRRRLLQRPERVTASPSRTPVRPVPPELRERFVGHQGGAGLASEVVDSGGSGLNLKLVQN